MLVGLFNLRSDNLEENLDLIRSTLENTQADIYLFGEGYLQGRDYPSFDYEKDIYKSLSKQSIEIVGLRKLAKETGKVLGFGYFENIKGGIYNSYLVIDGQGDIILETSALGRDWMKDVKNPDYRQGQVHRSFEVNGKRFLIMLGGDFYLEDQLIWYVEYDDRADAFIWLDRDSSEGYLEQSQILFKDVYALRDDGAYHLRQGNVLAQDERHLLIEV